MSLITLTTASGSFESARHVDILPEGHPCRNLHGHSFQATVFAELPSNWLPYAGAGVTVLRRRMEEVLSELTYANLNKIIDQPTDENIARWIKQRLGVPGIDRIAIQSTPHQGVDLDRDGIAHVWRRYRFQSAHRLPHVPMGHKCGRMHGHGFEAIVHANQEGLSNPTSEVISSWLWGRIQPALPELSWITVFETGSCGANFDGRNYRIWKEFTLDSAVQIKGAPANTSESRVHGHTFTLRLHLSAPLDTVLGWTIDFGDVKSVFNPIFKALDHQPLHEIAALADTDTTSIAQWIFKTTKEQLPQLVRVDLYETPGCGAIVAQDVAEPALPV